MSTKRTLNKAIKLTRDNSKKRGIMITIKGKRYILLKRFIIIISSFIILLFLMVWKFCWLFGHTTQEEQMIKITPEVIEEIEEQNEVECYGNSEDFVVTYYCGCEKCCGKYSFGDEDYAVGALGTRLTPYYSIAVDPNIIPLGTVCQGSDGRMYKAEDVGGTIKENHIDIFTGNHEDAIILGKGTIHLSW